MKAKFYICKHCGNIVGVIHSAGVPLKCCGENMQALEPGTVEASHEKHIPVVELLGDKISVKVGAVTHPMADEHYIEWIYVETERGGRRLTFKPGDAPEAVITLDGDKALAVYAYCNLHGLWMAEVK